MIPSGFIDVREAASILFISENRLRKWVRLGKIPFHRFNDYRILFKHSEVVDFMPIVWERLGRDKNWTGQEVS